MNSPLHPLPPSSAPVPQAPDLGAHEVALAGRMGALVRAHATPGLRDRCLAERPGWTDPAGWTELEPLPEIRRGGLWARRSAGLPTAAWAAVALLAIGVGVLSRSGSVSQPGASPEAPYLLGSVGRLKVVDDPSVPLFHGLETFDQLSPPALAVVGSGGGRDGR